MDKKSDGFRKGMVKTFAFGRKKTKAEAPRPTTAATIRPNTHELDSDNGAAPAPSIPRSRSQQFREPGLDRDAHEIAKSRSQQFRDNVPPPPQTKLPPIPEDAGLKRWNGSGRPPQNWNSLRHDTELWDHLGDTLVYLCSDGHKASRPAPSFRVSSHVIEATESRFLINLLRDGAIDDEYNLGGMPPSPINSGSRQGFPRRGRGHPSPPTPDGSAGGWEAEVIYEMYFPVPHGLTKAESLRHQIATRNVFALLYQVSLVGVNLYEALSDLLERLSSYMPQDIDTANMIIEYILEKGFDDVRENPSGAAALLAWSERNDVRWDEGWREGFVHAAGMYSRVENSINFKDVSTISKALLARASLELQVRVEGAEKNLENFDPTDMWPMMSAHAPPAQAAFQRLITFFLHHYKSTYQTWPPPAPAGGEQWLTRNLVNKLQIDFGALYDYLVNREVVWDGTQDRNGRKWNLKSPGNSSFNPDTSDLPFTDILVAFDNRHKFAHIPHPYPLVPDPAPVTTSQLNDTLMKTNKQLPPPPTDRMAERKAALAYTESTNIYILGSDFVNNALVEAFAKFEKSDCASGIDPFAARRGRWVLIYGILQVLSSVSVDTPYLRCKSDINYHLSPSLKGTPPWRPNGFTDEANQTGSHCWTIRSKWNAEPIITQTRRGPMTSVSSRSVAPSISGYSESDTGSSYRSPTYTTVSTRSANTRNVSSSHGPSRTQRIYLSSDQSASGYGQGIEKIEKLGEWPIREERERERERDPRMGRSRAGSMNRSERDNDLHSRVGRERDMDTQSRVSRDRNDDTHSRGGRERDFDLSSRVGRDRDTDTQSRAGSNSTRNMDGGRSRASSFARDRNVEKRVELQRDFSDRGGEKRTEMQREFNDRNMDKRVDLQRDFTIKDFENYNFRDGAGSLGGSEWMGGKMHE